MTTGNYSVTRPSRLPSPANFIFQLLCPDCFWKSQSHINQKVFSRSPLREPRFANSGRPTKLSSNRLAGTLAELKVRVRAAMATELASAVGTAVRDVLVVGLIDRLIVLSTPSSPGTGGWRNDRYSDRWGEPMDHWDDADDYDPRSHRSPAHYERDDREEPERNTTVQSVTAVAVGVNVGRWWLGRKGTVATAVGAGILTTMVGLAGGPVARAALAVLAAATDVLAADSALARLDHS